MVGWEPLKLVEITVIDQLHQDVRSGRIVDLRERKLRPLYENSQRRAKRRAIRNRTIPAPIIDMLIIIAGLRPTLSA